jgi:Homoserine dehydrogenase
MIVSPLVFVITAMQRASSAMSYCLSCAWLTSEPMFLYFLLLQLAYGATVPVEAVPCQGISSLTSADFEFARMMKSTIKLLGTAMLNPQGDKLSVFVSPVVVPLSR